MKRQAVKRRPRPGYPTRNDVRRDPRLLAENLPRSWRTNARLSQAAAALLALSTAGCGGKPEPGAATEPPEVVGEPRGGKSAPEMTAARVAPLFLHGEGRGATGCIVMNPPVFLSEEEALQVIVEELGRHGVTLTERNAVVDRAWTAPVAMDRADRGKRVAVEFISEDEFGELSERLGTRAFDGSTVRCYDFPAVARRLQAEIRRHSREHWNYGVFYDPVVTKSFRDAYRSIPDQLKGKARDEAFREAIRKERQAARDKARALLRKQVGEFAEWLRNEGVI